MKSYLLFQAERRSGKRTAGERGKGGGVGGGSRKEREKRRRGGGGGGGV